MNSLAKPLTEGLLKMTIESVTAGATYELFAGIKAANGISEIPIFVTINTDESGKITELFVRIDSKDHFEIVNLITRLASMALRAGVDPLIIANDLQGVYSMTSQHIIPGTTILCPSIIARIGLCLEQHVNKDK